MAAAGGVLRAHDPDGVAPQLPPRRRHRAGPRAHRRPPPAPRPHGAALRHEAGQQRGKLYISGDMTPSTST